MCIVLKDDKHYSRLGMKPVFGLKLLTSEEHRDQKCNTSFLEICDDLTKKGKKEKTTRKQWKTLKILDENVSEVLCGH